VIRAVVSDFGGVLTTSLQDAFLGWEQASGIPLPAMGVAMATIADRDGAHPLFELECGRMTQDDFLSCLGKQLSVDLERDVDMSDFTATYFGHLHPNVALLDALADWRDRGVRLALLTNNVREWEPYWRKMLPVDELFELVVDSAYVGMRKPDLEIYRLTCERLGEAPEACVFIDDFKHNCEAAREVGLHPVWYRGDDADTIAAVEELLAGPQAA
jgi:putative hydrolase of the HAD superfamily